MKVASPKEMRRIRRILTAEKHLIKCRERAYIIMWVVLFIWFHAVLKS